MQGYSGYGDGVGIDLRHSSADEMRADWAANREELVAFWRSGRAEADVFPRHAAVVVRGWQCGHPALGGKASRARVGTALPILAAKRKLLALNNKIWVLRGDLNVTKSCSRT